MNACLTAGCLTSGGGRELLMCQGSVDGRTAINVADTLLPKDHANEGAHDTRTILQQLEQVMLMDAWTASWTWAILLAFALLHAPPTLSCLAVCLHYLDVGMRAQEFK
jgi:hypothetical protein